LSYCVFVSYGWHDRWVARQAAANIRSQAGAEVFVDIFNTLSGDRIEESVHTGLITCNELIALLTPWSIDRNWVWSEMAGAWALKKRYVGIIYELTIEQIDRKHGGLAMLAPTNVRELNDFDVYLSELSVRVKASADA
jgi:hypothetical protein